MPPRTTLWRLEDHTRGKHMVLREYLYPWLAMILSTFERAMFVDAFAGPGEYEDGELGSPVIALNALAKHSSQHMMRGQIDYVFIEERPDRFVHLKNVISRLRAKGSIPSICKVNTYNDTFAHVFPKLIDSISSHRVPTFVMIDPFGVSGVGMENIRALMDHPSIEVYVSFMYEPMNRFKDQTDFESPLDDLFGCSDWRQGIDIPDSKERKEFFYGLYRKQLKLSGARHVLHFELYDGDKLKYALFFATQSDQGCDKMKQAMWKVAPTGGYSFRSDTLGQLSFESRAVDFNELDQALISEFGMDQPIAFESVEEFMRSDKVLFHSGRLKSHLARMERESTLVVGKSPRRRRGTFPPDTILRFVDPPPPSPRQRRLM